MSDKLGLVLGFIGFIIIAVVCVNNYDVTQNEKVFGADTYYVPQNTKYGQDSAEELYAQMSSSRSRTCPQTTLEYPSSKFVLTNRYGVTASNAYGATTFFVLRSVTEATDSNATDSNLATALGIPDSACNISGSVTFASLLPAYDWDSGVPVKIIAPFNFSFANNNTDDTMTEKKIVIQNNSGTCRITFDYVANWFCAGEYGTSYTTGYGTTETTTEWALHGATGTDSTTGSSWNAGHCTIVGTTSNASIKYGDAGACIGYANSNTTVTIEQIGSGAKTLSIKEFIDTVGQ